MPEGGINLAPWLRRWKGKFRGKTDNEAQWLCRTEAPGRSWAGWDQVGPSNANTRHRQAGITLTHAAGVSQVAANPVALFPNAEKASIGNLSFKSVSPSVDES